MRHEKNMKPHEKIARWMEENGVNAAELSRMSGIGTPKLSQILAGKQGATIHQVEPISRATGMSLDWIYNEDAEWPPLPRDGRGRILSDAEERLLAVAKELSDGDESLSIAFKRLWAVPTGFVGLPSGIHAEVRHKPDRETVVEQRERTSKGADKRTGRNGRQSG